MVEATWAGDADRRSQEPVMTVRPPEVVRQAPRVRPGWIEYQEGQWIRAALVEEVGADELPEEPDGIRVRTVVRTAGRVVRSPYATAAVLEALREAEPGQARAGADAGRRHSDLELAGIARAAATLMPLADDVTRREQASHDAGLALEDYLQRVTDWRTTLRFSDAVDDAEGEWRDALANAVARTAGAYLLASGQQAAWRALLILLQDRLGIAGGPGACEHEGDEVRFVESSGAPA